MATCKDCIHFNPCNSHKEIILEKPTEGNDWRLHNKVENECKHFNPTADVVEVETIKAWLYSIAINNVGCNLDGDFSVACEEIIKRLDGLRRFAKERSSKNDGSNDKYTADVVEVVRCKDCKKRYVPCYCALWHSTVNGREMFLERGDYFFCSYGERSSNE